MSKHVPDVRIDDLLAHTGWVRGLALSLVRDPGAADDLVQETWLAAMRRPPTGDRPVRGWLAGVVRNLARQRRRGEMRRVRRESVVGQRREPLPSTGELAERMETQRDLAEAILALDEPWRATVILRYLEGLSSAEIARRQEVPGATVRGRLKRGLETLRRKLDDGHGGDRHAWHIALLPFLPRPIAPAPTGTSTATTTSTASALVSGVLTMSIAAKVFWSSAILVLVFGALGVTGVVPLLGGEPEQLPKLGTVSSVSKGNEVPRGPLLRGSGRAPAAGNAADAVRAPATASIPAPGNGRIEARVVDAEGTALSNAIVYEVFDPENRTTSDREGRVALEIAEAACGTLLNLIVHCEDHELRELEVLAHAGKTTRLGDVSLAPGGAVRGRVLDADGRLVDGAQVMASTPDLSPGERRRGPVDGPMKSPLPVPVVAVNGSFEFPGLPVGFVRVWATHPGMRYTFSEPIEIRTGHVQEGVDLHLLPLRAQDAIRGRVTYPDGKSAGSATVRYEIRTQQGAHRGTMETNEDGLFELRMGGGGTATLRVTAEGGWSSLARHDVAPSDVPIEVTLGKSPIVRVKVGTVDGMRPLLLGVHALSTTAPRILTWYAGGFPSDGVAELAAPNEPYRIEVTADGYRTVKLGPFDADSAPEGVEAMLERLPTLQGVVWAHGKPLAGAELRLHRPSAETDHVRHNGFDVRVDPTPIAQARTDAEGRYALGIEESGRFILRADAEGFAPAEKDELRVDAEHGESGLDFELTQGGVLEGVVRTGSGQDGVGLAVGISRADGYARTQRTQVGGKYRFENLMPGDYEVRIVEFEIHSSASRTAVKKGVEPPSILWSCTIDANGTTTYDIDMRAEEARHVLLKGSILVDGAVPRGWTFELMTDPGERGLPMTLEMGSVDAEGRFAITADAPGRYRLMVTSEGQSQGRRGLYAPVELAAGLNEWAVSLRTGTLEGVVESGRPGPNVRIFLVWIGPEGAVGLTQIDPADDGTFRVEGVFAGRNRIVRLERTAMAKMKPVDAMNPENWPAVADVDVGAGRITKVEIP